MVDDFVSNQKYLESLIKIKEDQISDLNKLITKWKLRALNYKEDYDEKHVKIVFEIPIDSLIVLKRDIEAKINMLYSAKKQINNANKINIDDYNKIKYGIYSTDPYRW